MGVIKKKERRLIKSTEGVIRQKHRGGLLLHLKIKNMQPSWFSYSQSSYFNMS